MTDTWTIQIGNTDNKLTQQAWSDYVKAVDEWVDDWAQQVHFRGFSPANAPWQNACWVLEPCTEFRFEEDEPYVRIDLQEIAGHFDQDSIAVTRGVTEFIPAVNVATP